LAGGEVHSVDSDLATIVETRTTRLVRGEVGEGRGEVEEERGEVGEGRGETSDSDEVGEELLQAQRRQNQHCCIDLLVLSHCGAFNYLI
jgi:hypothetical protein